MADTRLSTGAITRASIHDLLWPLNDVAGNLADIAGGLRVLSDYLDDIDNRASGTANALYTLLEQTRQAMMATHETAIEQGRGK